MDASGSSSSEINTEYLENEEVQKVANTIKQKEIEKDGASSPKTKAKKKPKSVPLISLWKYAKKRYQYLALLAICCSIASGVLSPLVITVVGRLLHKVGNQSFFFDLPPHELSQYLKANHINLVDEFHSTILNLVYFGIGMLVTSYFAEALWVYTSEEICRDIRERYVKAILRQDIGWHDSAEDGSLTTRLALDTSLIQEGMGEKLGMAFRSMSSFIAALVIAYIYGWKLALVMSVCLPLSAAIGMVVVAKIKKYTTQTQEVYASAGAVAEQAISGIRTVYAFSLQNRFVKLYDSKLVGAERFEARRGVIFGCGMGFYFCFQYAVYGLGFWYGSRQVIDGEIAGSSVMVVFFSLILGTTALVAIPTSLQAIGQAQAAAYKVFAVIDRVPVIDSESPDGIKKEKLQGEIEFNNVDFHYPTRPDVPILKGLSLKIHPGQTVAFVGPSGSGKSTSVALVQRLYDVIGGQVLIDGHDIKDYNIHSLREHIGLVGQEPVLFNMSIKANILMGTVTPVSEKRLIEVCKMANCHNFISMLPHGYDTSVGEYGGMLSGGQKQRIAIARALIKDPRILLLDEATSALDTASERIVQRALEVAAENRTTIVIAHRLSTIRNADLIVVMDKGQLIEQGNHNSLYELNGVYRSLVEKQKIMMKEGGDKHEIGHEEEKFNVPNQAVIAPNPQQVVIDVGSDSLLSVPSPVEMIRAANARREAEKKDIKKKKKTVDRSYTLAVLNLMRGDWPLLLLGGIGGAVAGATSPVFAYLLGNEIIELLSPDKSKISPSAFSGANLYAFLFVMVGLAALAGFTLQNVCFDYAGAKLTRKLRFSAFKHLLTLEVGFYDEDDHTLGALTSRLASDAADVSLMVGRAWGETAQFFVTIIVGLVLCFVTAANVTGVVLILMPVAMYATYYRSQILRGFEQKTRKAYAEASTVAAEAIKSIRTVVALGQESWFVERFSASLEYPHQLGLSKTYRDSIGFALNGAVAQFIAALTYYAGMRLIEGGHVGFKEVYVTLMTAMVTTQALGRSSQWSSSLDKGKIGAIKTWEIFDRPTKINPDSEGLEPSPAEFEPSFDFENISFTYPARPNQPIFAGEFNVGGRPNQTLALVGPSGCGKSTTIGMLERWYDCNGGSVSVGGHNVKDYQLKRGLRRNMALVGQEPVLFDMSIHDNLVWGMDTGDEAAEVSLDEIVAAASMANVHKFISSLPNGYNTRVGDKGSQLSGGQKQRIAIARALIRKPKILLLDEATSALDSESEKLVQQALDKASMGRTTVTIAHRLSTIQNADQIAVVQNGKIVELGRHFELLELNGLYADLVRQQDLGVH